MSFQIIPNQQDRRRERRCHSTGSVAVFLSSINEQASPFGQEDCQEDQLNEGLVAPPPLRFGRSDQMSSNRFQEWLQSQQQHEQEVKATTTVVHPERDISVDFTNLFETKEDVPRTLTTVESAVKPSPRRASNRVSEEMQQTFPAVTLFRSSLYRNRRSSDTPRRTFIVAKSPCRRERRSLLNPWERRSLNRPRRSSLQSRSSDIRMTNQRKRHSTGDRSRDGRKSSVTTTQLPIFLNHPARVGSCIGNSSESSCRHSATSVAIQRTVGMFATTYEKRRSTGGTRRTSTKATRGRERRSLLYPWERRSLNQPRWMSQRTRTLDPCSDMLERKRRSTNSCPREYNAVLGGMAAEKL